MGNYGYGGPPPPGYGAPQYGYRGGYPPPKKSVTLRGLAIAALCVVGSCAMVGTLAGKSERSQAKAATAQVDPAVQAANTAAARKAEEEAKAAREKNAVETFPTKKSEIAASIKKASSSAIQAKWKQADAELAPAERALADYRDTSISSEKDFRDLDTKANAMRAKLAPQLDKIAQAEAAAAQERMLKENAIVVSSVQLGRDYHANEVAADENYKGKDLLVTGNVASIDKAMFGGLVLRLASDEMFGETVCRMDDSEKAGLASLTKGSRVRVLCTGGGMILGSPALHGCVFR